MLCRLAFFGALVATALAAQMPFECNSGMVPVRADSVPIANPEGVPEGTSGGWLIKQVQMLPKLYTVMHFETEFGECSNEMYALHNKDPLGSDCKLIDRSSDTSPFDDQAEGFCTDNLKVSWSDLTKQSASVRGSIQLIKSPLAEP